MRKRKIRPKILGSQGIIYRIFIIICNAIFFKVGAKQALEHYGALGASLIWNSINMALYFLYHSIFVKLFSLEVQTKGFVLWFTGLPCSGKTTLANKVKEILNKKGLCVERLDGDIVRQSLSYDLGFSPEDREKNLKRVAFVCDILSRNNVAVLSSFVSPYRSIRAYIRSKAHNFIEVFVRASAEECAKRDIKGMWAKAKAGIIKNFTGYNAIYEAPLNAEIEVNTDNETIEESTRKIVSYLKRRKLI